MTSPADPVRDACVLLAGYLPVLERLLAEPDAGGPAPGMHARRPEAPEPWNAPAGRALMDAHEGVRRLEAALRYALNGHPGARRGGSAGNTAAALAAIPRLAAGLDGDAEAVAARIVERWANQARSVPAIDEAQRWRPLRGRTCPYCGSAWLKADMDARPPRIACFCQWCPGDGNGLRPVAAMGTDGHGRPVLAWADGLTETAPDLEDLCRVLATGQVTGQRQGFRRLRHPCARPRSTFSLRPWRCPPVSAPPPRRSRPA